MMFTTGQLGVPVMLMVVHDGQAAADPDAQNTIMRGTPGV